MTRTAVRSETTGVADECVRLSDVPCSAGDRVVEGRRKLEERRKTKRLYASIPLELYRPVAVVAPRVDCVRLELFGSFLGQAKNEQHNTR